MNNDKLAAFIQQFPKAELHVHLEGAVDPKTVLKMVIGMIYIIAGQAILLYPRLRRIELEMPDTVTEPELISNQA